MPDPIVLLPSAIAAGKLLIDYGVPAAQKGWSWFKKNLELPGDRQKLICRMLLREGRCILEPGHDYHAVGPQPSPPSFPFGYPHDIEALIPFLSLLPIETIAEAHPFFTYDRLVTDQLVTSGSPKSNQLSSRYLPFCQAKGTGVPLKNETFTHHAAIPYWMVEDLTRPYVEVISKMRGGVPDQKTRKALSVKSGSHSRQLWYPEGYLGTKTLERDFLLVSRLPWNELGAPLVILAGGHGAGTESIRLVFETLHIADLRELENRLGGKPYWQFVVEVTEIEHTPTGTIPRQVRISPDLPPQVID